MGLSDPIIDLELFHLRSRNPWSMADFGCTRPSFKSTALSLLNRREKARKQRQAVGARAAGPPDAKFTSTRQEEVSFDASTPQTCNSGAMRDLVAPFKHKCKSAVARRDSFELSPESNDHLLTDTASAGVAFSRSAPSQKKVVPYCYDNFSQPHIGNPKLFVFSIYYHFTYHQKHHQNHHQNC